MVTVVSNNRIRLLSDVLAVDAWYSLLDGSATRYSVFSDVSFSQARIGGETDTPIYFDLAVRRALLRLYVVENDEITIPRLSVREYNHDSQISSSLQRKNTLTAQISASSGITLGVNNGYKGDLGVAGTIDTEGTRTSEANLTLHSSRYISVRSQTLPSGEFQWHLEPLFVDHLVGRAWPRDSALLDFVVQNPSVLESNVVRILITCKNDDLKIDNIRTKDSEGNWLSWLSPTPKRAAAAHCIRKSLLEGGLQFRDVENPYCEVQLADLLLVAAIP